VCRYIASHARAYNENQLFTQDLQSYFSIIFLRRRWNFIFAGDNDVCFRLHTPVSATKRAIAPSSSEKAVKLIMEEKDGKLIISHEGMKIQEKSMADPEKP
jgi:hypothetical protein